MNIKNILILLSLITINTNASTYYFTIDDKLKHSIIVDTTNVWNDSTSTFTDWLNVNAAYDFSLYLPEITNQTERFTQTQTFKQDQQQFEQKRQFEERLNEYQNIGEPIEHLQTIELTNTREINVLFSNYENHGSYINCSGWTPNANTITAGVTFTQNNDCEIEKKRNINYQYEDNILISKEEFQMFNEIQTQEATGTLSLPPVVTNYPSNRCATQEFVVTGTSSGGFNC